VKYKAVYICPICSKGDSTGLAPIQVRIMITLTIVQNFVFIEVLNFVVFFLFLLLRLKLRWIFLVLKLPLVLRGLSVGLRMQIESIILVGCVGELLLGWLGRNFLHLQICLGNLIVVLLLLL